MASECSCCLASSLGTALDAGQVLAKRGLGGHGIAGISTEAIMSALLKPSRLRDHSEYHAALRELEELFLCDPNSPAGKRFDQLVSMIDEFDCRSGKVDACRPGNVGQVAEDDPCTDWHRHLPNTPEEAERERRLYGMHADPLSGLPTTDDPECDLAREATIRR
jgi:hypothetical protein